MVRIVARDQGFKRTAEARRTRSFFLEKQTPRTSALSASPRCALKRLLASQVVELLADVVELVLQRGGAVEEVLGGLAFPGNQRAVQVIGVLADAFLAGDGPALLGGHDLLLDVVEL